MVVHKICGKKPQNKGIFHKVLLPFLLPLNPHGLLTRMGKEVLHTLDVGIGILSGKVAVDIVDGLNVGVAALSHHGLRIPSEVKAQTNIAMPQTMHTSLGKTMLLTQAVDKAV